MSRGSWGISSAIDPRWNKYGTTEWACTGGICPPARNWIEEAKALYGEAPTDLSYSFYKE